MWLRLARRWRAAKGEETKDYQTTSQHAGGSSQEGKGCASYDTNVFLLEKHQYRWNMLYIPTLGCDLKASRALSCRIRVLRMAVDTLPDVTRLAIGSLTTSARVPRSIFPADHRDPHPSLRIYNIQIEFDISNYIILTINNINLHLPRNKHPGGISKPLNRGKTMTPACRGPGSSSHMRSRRCSCRSAIATAPPTPRRRSRNWGQAPQDPFRAPELGSYANNSSCFTSKSCFTGLSEPRYA